MSKQSAQLERDIVNRYGMLVNLTQAAELLGYSKRDSAKRFLQGVPVVNMGRDHKYLARDIAQRICSCMAAN